MIVIKKIKNYIHVKDIRTFNLLHIALKIMLSKIIESDKRINFIK